MIGLAGEECGMELISKKVRFLKLVFHEGMELMSYDGPGEVQGLEILSCRDSSQ